MCLLNIFYFFSSPNALLIKCCRSKRYHVWLFVIVMFTVSMHSLWSDMLVHLKLLESLWALWSLYGADFMHGHKRVPERLVLTFKSQYV